MALGMTCKLSICALFLVALAYQASAAPARLRRTTVLRLLSDNAEGYIKVASSGTSVSATGTSTEDETKFNEFTGSLPGYFKFESAEYSGKYLVLDNGELKADTPSNGNEEWEEVFIAPDVYGFKQSGCFIGFDTNGDVVDPCSLSSTDAEVKIQRDT